MIKRFRTSALFCLFACLALFAFAQEAGEEPEHITLPDLSTRVTGDSETVVPQAVPDFGAVLPDGAPVLPDLPSLAVPEDAAESLTAEGQRQKNASRVFLEGTVGAGYSGFFTGDFRIFKPLGRMPFDLAFSHETANGYAQKSAASGFYDSATALSAGQAYSFTDAFTLKLAGSYQSAANGLQGQSTLFYNTTLQQAKAGADFIWKLPRDFYLETDAGFSWLNRFCGYLQNSAAAAFPVSTLTDIAVTPLVRGGWNKNGLHVYASAAYTSFWATLSQTAWIQRGYFTVGTELALPALPDFKTGAAVSAAVSNAGNFVVPFSVFVSSNIKPVFVYAEGGMKSALSDTASLLDAQPFAGFAPSPVEQTDWYAHLKIDVPAGMFSFGAVADFSKTAFANGTLFPAYAAFDAQTGLYPLTVQDRTVLDTEFSAGLHKGMFGVILGYKAHWLDKNPLYPDHALTAQAAVFSPEGLFAVTLGADFGFTGDVVPVLSLSGYYRVTGSISLAAEITDMIKLFSARGRELTGPYITRSGIAAVKVKVLF